MHYDLGLKISKHGIPYSRLLDVAHNQFGAEVQTARSFTAVNLGMEVVDNDPTLGGASHHAGKSRPNEACSPRNQYPVAHGHTISLDAVGMLRPLRAVTMVAIAHKAPRSLSTNLTWASRRLVGTLAMKRSSSKHSTNLGTRRRLQLGTYE